jgi:hypothetical protein
MTVDLELKALEPLASIISVDEFPLAGFAPAGTVESLFEAIYLVDPVVTVLPAAIRLDTGLAWEGELSLAIPGTDLLTLLLSPGAPGWTALWCRMVVGAGFELTVHDIAVVLRVSDQLLVDDTTGGPVDLAFTTSMQFTPDGVELLEPVTVDLPPARIGSTGLTVTASGVSIVTGSAERPGFLDSDEFEGLVVDEGTVTVPPEWFEQEDGSPLELAITDAAIGTSGFTGTIALRRGDAGAPDGGQFAGFPARFQSLSVSFVEGAIDEASLSVDIRLPSFEQGSERYINLAASIATDGDLSASLSAVQTDGGGDPDHLVSLDIADAVRLGIDALRLERRDERWTVWLAGAIAVAIGEIASGDPWPGLSFSEIGIGDDGSISLGDDAGITLDVPVTVDFDLARLSLETMRLGAGSTDGSLVVGVNGGIELLKGLPVGVSVQGLAIEFTPGGGPVTVTLDGIGIGMSVPGSYSAEVEVGYTSSGVTAEFRGRGALAIPALDVDVDVAMLVGRDHVEQYNYFQVFADARLMPTGIPIANTGISIYGLQGLVARNRAPAWDMTAPADERYYDLFAAAPVGITDLDKWRNEEGQSALGIGIVVGTLDRGFLFSSKGLFVVTFPDVTLVLQSLSRLVSVAPELADATEGTIQSLLVYAAAERALSFDLDVAFEIPVILSLAGNAGAFFDFDDPAAWYVELGRDAPSRRMTANVLGWQGTWLFTAGSWFRIDAEALDTGVRLDVDLTAEKAGFWVGATGYAAADMYLSWSPLQWEGRAGYGLTIGAGYKKLAISFQFDGAAGVTVPSPTGFDITLEACVSLLVTDICKSFRFTWELPDPPSVSSPEARRFAAPRHYTVHPDEDGSHLIDGVAALGDPSGDGPSAELNSVVTVEFDRPMIDAVGFNEGIALPDGGYRTIGDQSNWSSASELTDLWLVRDPDGDPERVPLWGTWALDTLEQNTRLRLFSSERFDHDGSLTSSFVSGYTIDYCAEPAVTRTCVDLRGLHLGYQWLPGGSVAAWLGTWTNDNTDVGLVMGESKLLLYLVGAPRDVLVKVYVPWLDGNHHHYIPAVVEPEGVLQITAELVGDAYVVEVCWRRGHSGHQWSATRRSGVIVTDHEAWSVPAELLVLRPHSTYELGTTTRTTRKSPSGNIDTPLGDVVTISRFHTDGPPAFDGALADLVAGVVPAPGARATYLGYDLVVRFVDEYVPYMWTSVGAELRVRLVDASGRAVLDERGNEALGTVTTAGALEHSITTQVWDQLVEEYRDGPCLPVSPPPLPAIAETVEYVSGSRLADLLQPNTRYEAQVVSTADPAQPLTRWTFTTGRYATFTDLVDTGREVLAAHRAPARQSGSGDFDTEMRVLGLATIAYVDHVTLTPVLNRAGTKVQCWLLESPEPLEPTSRLGVAIDGHDATLVANGDGTRALAIPRVMHDPGDTEITLLWHRDPVGLAALTVDGIGGDEQVVFTVTTDAIRNGEAS